MIYIESGFLGVDYDLTHPRVLWNSVTRRGTVSASTSADGFDATNAATATTFDEWQPTAFPATWQLTFDATETVSALAIDTHALGSTETTVAVQSWNGSSWSTLVSASPEDDEPIAFLFTPISTDRLRIYLTGTVVPTIAVIHISDALELPRPVYASAPVPIDMATEVEFETTQAATGPYLGRSILRTKKQNSFKVLHLEESYVRETLKPFFLDARLYPYFLLERPLTVPEALSYRWKEGDIQPQRMGIRNYMEVDL